MQFGNKDEVIGNGFVWSDSSSLWWMPQQSSFVGESIPAGGYLAEFSGDSTGVNMQKWDSLVAANWTDHLTSVVVIEFSVYDLQTELAIVASITSDFLPNGHVINLWSPRLLHLKQLHKSLHRSNTLILESLMALLVPLFAFQELKEMRHSGLSLKLYLTSLWNIIECVMVLLFVPVLILSFCSHLMVRHLEINLETPESRFIALHPIARIVALQVYPFDGRMSINIILFTVNCRDLIGQSESCVCPLQRHLSAVLSLLLWTKVLKYLTVFPTFGVLWIALEKMFANFASFIIVLSVFLIGFAHASHLTYYAARFVDRSFWYSLMNVVRTLYGESAYETARWGSQEDAWMGNLLFVLQVCINFVLLLNLLIAVLSKAYQDVIEDAASRYAIDFARLVATVHSSESEKANRIHPAGAVQDFDGGKCWRFNRAERLVMPPSNIAKLTSSMFSRLHDSNTVQSAS
jgi:hypothetical protein